ncbi:hypothetical protein LWI28_020297 [Acer negundo]|uniref:Uncharacterized protein n=1 Tax=Acer negundo TaxID=4023 RepID=A0AAD5P005_ACENE|nr:hypothetical protein LWI28_020297 [Acer negundo]
MEETVQDVKESKKKKKRKSSCNFISSDQQQLSSSHKKRKSSTRVVSPYFQKEVSKKKTMAAISKKRRLHFTMGDSTAHLHVRKVGKQKQELLNGCNEEERRKAHLQVRKVSPYFQTATEDTKTKQESSPRIAWLIYQSEQQGVRIRKRNKKFHKERGRVKARIA